VGSLRDDFKARYSPSYGREEGGHGGKMQRAGTLFQAAAFQSSVSTYKNA
jgi:hypothetical protein